MTQAVRRLSIAYPAQCLANSLPRNGASSFGVVPATTVTTTGAATVNGELGVSAIPSPAPS
jgi:hypothetical protein